MAAAGVPNLLHDGDKKYCRGFRRLLKDAGVRPVRLPPYSPNLNAFAERWVKSIKTECLQFFCPMTRASVEYVIKQYVAHYQVKSAGSFAGSATGSSPASLTTIWC